MRIGIVSGGYFDTYDYAEGLRRMREDGYDCVDYNSLVSMRSPLYALPDAELFVFLEGVRAAAERLGIEIGQMHAIWGTVNNDATEPDRLKTTEFFIRDLAAAQRLGCPRLVLHPLLPFGHDVEGDYAYTYARNLQLLRDLIPHAERCGVTVCVENLPFSHNPISRVSEVKRLVSEIDHPLVGVCLDTGHANIFSNDLAADVRTLGRHLKALHVHDNAGWCDAHLLPYCGSVRWEPFLVALGEIGFSGTLSLEARLGREMPEPHLSAMRRELAALARRMAEQTGI